MENEEKRGMKSVRKERIKAEEGEGGGVYVRARGSIINAPSTIVFLSATSMPINRSSVSRRVESIDPRRGSPNAGRATAWRTLINRA